MITYGAEPDAWNCCCFWSWALKSSQTRPKYELYLLRTAISAVDLNIFSYFLAINEKQLVMEVLLLWGLLSSIRSRTADCHLEQIKSKPKVVASLLCQRGSGSWISCQHYQGCSCCSWRVSRNANEDTCELEAQSLLFHILKKQITTTWKMTASKESANMLSTNPNEAASRRYFGTMWTSMNISSDPQEVLYWNPGSRALQHLCRR